MVSHLSFYQLVLIALVWLCVMLHWAWPSDPAAACPPPELPPLLPTRKRDAPDVLVWAVGALAEGLGIRAVARVFEVDPNTVLQWLVEAAEQLQAFSQSFLHDVRVTQVQLDERFALLSAGKAGELSEPEAITRLSRSPHWVWAALD